MVILIKDAQIIDAISESPWRGSILIENDRISDVGRTESMSAPPGADVVDATGKFAIPGLMNANVHLLLDIKLENLLRHEGRYEELIVEAAQVALKSGQTTVFDTWGPRRQLMVVRDEIAAGRIEGSRIFCAGNIIGFDGPYSPDFRPKSVEFASAEFVDRTNAMWVENVGRRLMWLNPEDIAKEVQSYIAKGIDFVKYASNEHGLHSDGAFLQFSLEQQTAIVDEAHRAGITAQAHSTSVEGLRLAIEAGCDLVTHCNITGPVPIPASTLALFVENQVGAAVFNWTGRGYQWLRDNDLDKVEYQSAAENARNLIRVGAPLLLATDAGLRGPRPKGEKIGWVDAPEGESLGSLSGGHLYWFRAMEEMGCSPMAMLRAATHNIAVAYGKEADLGTIEAGKFADVLLLRKNPLEAARNYETIDTVIKSGKIVDGNSLPVKPLLSVLK